MGSTQFCKLLMCAGGGFSSATRSAHADVVQLLAALPENCRMHIPAASEQPHTPIADAPAASHSHSAFLSVPLALQFQAASMLKSHITARLGAMADERELHTAVAAAGGGEAKDWGAGVGGVGLAAEGRLGESRRARHAALAAAYVGAKRQIFEASLKATTSLLSGKLHASLAVIKAAVSARLMEIQPLCQMGTGCQTLVGGLSKGGQVGAASGQFIGSLDADSHVTLYTEWRASGVLPLHRGAGSSSNGNAHGADTAAAGGQGIEVHGHAQPSMQPVQGHSLLEEVVCKWRGGPRGGREPHKRGGEVLRRPSTDPNAHSRAGSKPHARHVPPLQLLDPGAQGEALGAGAVSEGAVLKPLSASNPGGGVNGAVGAVATATGILRSRAPLGASRTFRVTAPARGAAAPVCAEASAVPPAFKRVTMPAGLAASLGADSDHDPVALGGCRLGCRIFLYSLNPNGSFKGSP